MTFDPAKPCRTKSGLPARFLGKLECNNSGYPLVFAVRMLSGEEFDLRYSENGKRDDCPSDMDLTNLPVKHMRKVWINCYSSMQFLFLSRASADANAGLDRIACKHIIIEFEEGEGL